MSLLMAHLRPAAMTSVGPLAGHNADIEQTSTSGVGESRPDADIGFSAGCGPISDIRLQFSLRCKGRFPATTWSGAILGLEAAHEVRRREGARLHRGRSRY